MNRELFKAIALGALGGLMFVVLACALAYGLTMHVFDGLLMEL